MGEGLDVAGDVERACCPDWGKLLRVRSDRGFDIMNYVLIVELG